MTEGISLVINLGILALLLTLGLLVGGYRERKHLRELEVRERQVSSMVITQLRSFPQAVVGTPPPTLLIGEAVIATDYLKSFLANLRNLFGGEVRSYQTLLARARRESLLRILEQAQQQGYGAVCNVRYQTADVGGNSTRRKTAMVCIIASATAYHIRVSAV